MLDSAFLDVLRADQLLEIDDRHHLQVLQQTEYPNYFLIRLAGQLIEKILNGAFPVHCCVEDDRSVYGCMLTHMLTFLKVILAILFSWDLPAAPGPGPLRLPLRMREVGPGADHPGGGVGLHPGCRFVSLRAHDQTGRRSSGRHPVFQVQKNH
jgi:hypothetical protein